MITVWLHQWSFVVSAGGFSVIDLHAIISDFSSEIVGSRWFIDSLISIEEFFDFLFLLKYHLKWAFSAARKVNILNVARPVDFAFFIGGMIKEPITKNLSPFGH